MLSDIGPTPITLDHVLHKPISPRSLAQRRFEPRRLRAIVTRVVPVLRWLERIVRPRWTTPFQTTKRVVGAAVALLALALLVPVPLSNLVPAVAMGLVAIAYVEEDGLLLSVALMIVAVLLATGGLLLWEAASTTGWIESAF
ncbi:exopolysaccharide biosynthesis protein [Roseomonas hellenica]|uniref:Exopolysaccharide biosynthesis protein n=2 Tax=Plastoroseomonas hellenica TaxID=2687306 RepID=A0ABS5F3V1_9PROT|nr:exopolysaccharide biosynthesis protein [Plastoroseomonas hellenica]